MEKKAQTPKERIEDLVDLLEQPAEMKKSISDIKNSLHALQASEIRYRRLFETAQDGILILNAETGEIDDVNPYMIDMLHYSREEFLGMKLWEVSPFKDKVFNKGAFEELQEKGYIRYKDLPLETKEGKPVAVEFVSNVYQANGNRVIQCNIRNITEHKKAEKALRESEEKYRWVLNNMADVVVVMDMNLRFTYVSPSIMLMRGYTAEEATAQTIEQVMTPESLQIVSRFFEEEMKLEASGTADPARSRILEVEEYRKDGSIVLMENHLSFLRDETQKAVGIISLTRDITERRRAEEKLRESENKYRLLADNVHDVIFVLDMNFNFTYVSPSVKALRGYEPEEVMKQLLSKTLTPSSWDLVTKTMAAAMEQEKEHRELNISRTLQLEMLRKDGTTVWTEENVSFIRNENQQPVGILGVIRDITERRKAGEALLESEEQYRLVVENAKESIIITQDEKAVFANNAAKDMVGYSKEILTSKSFTALIHPDDRNMVVDHHIKRIKGEEVPPVYSFRVITQDGTVIWCELNAAVIQWKGKPATLVFLNNITERKKAEEELQQTLESLRKSIGATIQTMVSAVEMRDPYTAGHQLRVANLAIAIAKEMGLPQDKIEGIRMAGSIHDIGKLSIPAEILSKPTKLTNIEFSLIKEHSLSGYEMLKNVESPWPLAQIVYQHHERMNGSGYPRNLKGDEILIEARIMAVADVVESMASHRPYRPTLGIEAALEEIEKNKGILYDAAVVDACLRLFREKGYQLT
ncbi:MAG: PAS domain S-box protein [Smithella sp.]|jgi:PAS domain S-box-containing protein/putative nucleotidyltransferase with HDIG domain